jgi:hypothetical protein
VKPQQKKRRKKKKESKTTPVFTHINPPINSAKITQLNVALVSPWELQRMFDGFDVDVWGGGK